MLRHYLQVALRGFLRHKLYTFINVIGLSVALTCAIFVILFVRYQLSYDKWIPDTRRVYRVEGTVRMPGAPPASSAVTPYPLGVAMREQVPGVTGATHLLLPTTMTLTHGDRQFLQQNVDFVDANFFTTIRLPFVEGDPRSALSQPESVVLSESAAREYFGNSDPMGRTLTTNRGSCPQHTAACNGEPVSLRVTGIVRDLPQNTQLMGDVFVPTGSLADPAASDERQTWFRIAWVTYVTLASGVTPAAVLAAMPSVLDQDLTGEIRKSGIPLRGSQVYTIHLTSFAQVHLSSPRWRSLKAPVSWNTLDGVMIVGILILLVACFNFTNLATARAASRAREIGLRKTLGAKRRELTVQFLAEAALLALISLACAVAAAEMLLPAFNDFLHQSIGLDYVSDWRLDLILIGVAAVAALMSGIYPALVLSRLRPVAALQAKAGGSHRLVGLRDVLVLMQFAVSIGLGIAAIVVFRQVDYARNLDLGFQRNNILVIGNSTLTGERQEAFAQALRGNPGVSEVGLSDILPFGNRFCATNVQVPGQPSQITLDCSSIGPNYPRTYGIALVAGRLLSASRGDDRRTDTTAKGTVNVLVNVAGAKKMGFTPEEAVGKTFLVDGRVRRIVGVLGDTKPQGARQPASPIIYEYYPDTAMNFSVRLRPGRIPQTLAFIDQTWHAFLPTVAIQRSFLNAGFEQLYVSDQREGTLFLVFVIIAIVIASLGLYGFVVFTAERRTKEVGIRKISGARTADIVRLMLWRISVPVLVANLIAWPVTYYYLRGWLQGFAYRISLNPLYFVAAGAAALLIAWATVYANTLRLASASPVHALRYE
ncbi:MAG: FtsX-like permease family protein [Steroidobacteraceae bacterium]